MKILHLDIETSPNIAYVWGLWQQNVAINQIVDAGSILCWSAKWDGDEKTMYGDVRDSKKLMLARIHDLLDHADVVVHYNGKKFDIPTLNKEFILNGFQPPSPYKQIDLYQVVKRKFKFASNKLDFVAEALGIGGKVRHAGFEMWVKCMHNDPEAWEVMKEYNQQDVELLVDLYKLLLPWVPNHPNVGAHEGVDHVCPNCGSDHVHKRGNAYTQAGVYQRYRCEDCGTWSRAVKGDIQKNRLVGIA